MKRWVFIISVVWASAVVAFGAINVPSDGSDGALHVTANMVIDLSQAVTGSWNANNAAHAGKGIYDPEKWAVVFKYSSVTVEAGATVTFKNHPSRAPVVWLVSGNVTINGTVSLNGQHWQNSPRLAEPGPGGFRGGVGRYSDSYTSGAGFGIGGGRRTSTLGYGGQFSYGNPSLLPLIGGSGGGGGQESSSSSFSDYNPRSGGGGGGAILIASSSTISIGGVVCSNGGNGLSSGSSTRLTSSGGGSGGSIRIVGNHIQGTGSAITDGGGGETSGSQGRIRFEYASIDGVITTLPSPSVIVFESGATPLIWLPNDGPTVRIVSVGGNSAPSDPRASLETQVPDVQLPETSSAQVIIETVNVEEVSTVQLRVTPRGNANFTTVNATMQEVINPNPLTIRWVANAPLNPGGSALQVRVVRP